jgi:flagellar motor protein MotB
MRNIRRLHHEQDEEESVFVPMTDMTVSFLFILMILLAFFAVRFSDVDTVPKAEYDQLRNRFDLLTLERDSLITQRAALLAQIERLKADQSALQAQAEALIANSADLLEQIKQREAQIEDLQKQIAALQKTRDEVNPLAAYISTGQVRRSQILQILEEDLKQQFGTKVQVEISPENDALRFKGEGLFALGAQQLTPEKLLIVEKLAELTVGAIACFTINTKNIDYADCNPDGVIIEALQIEGHADSVGNPNDNLILSTKRAQEAFFAMLAFQPDLLDYKNARDQPILSVSAYGNMRPVTTDFVPLLGEAENRRIDLRLIMHTPEDSEQVEQIQKDIQNGLRLGIGGANGP